MTELDLHKQVVAFLRVTAPECLWYHPATGEARDAITGAKLKAMGTLAGTPDLAFVLPGGKAAFIEFKSPKGRMSPAQEKFSAACDMLGAPYQVCRSLPEVEGVLRAWGLSRGRVAA